jgi:hypothetical protein
LKSIILLPLWAIFGVGLAFLFLISQKWSAFAIQPSKPRTSKWLILGGAIIRWVIIGLIFTAAATSSIAALFTLFFSFLISRVLILNTWQKSFDIDKRNIH